MQTSHLPDPTLDAQFYAGVPIKRIFAWCIDVVLVTILCFGLVIITLGLGAFIFPLLAFGANLAYRIYGLNTWSATLGMRMVGIEIRNMQGDRLDLKEATLHTLLFVFIFITGLGVFANALSVLISDRGQGLHDMILGTAAINRPAD